MHFSPVRLFKEVELKSIKESAIIKVLIHQEHLIAVYLKFSR